MELSVIIVNYNVKYFLEQCLYSVSKACAKIDAEIIVVDNYSTDGSRNYLQPKFPSVNFIWNTANSGFSCANNMGLKKAKGRYVVFLNPDTIIAEDSLEKSIAFFHDHPDCGALGVRMIDGSGKYLKESKRSFPSPAAGFFKMTGLAALFPGSKLFAAYYAGHLPDKENNQIDVLAGAFMMAGRDILEKLNGFDESYFMYGEDIDLSYRIRQAGYKNFYFAGTTIIHFKGESTQKNSRNYIRHFYGAMTTFVNKHYRQRRLLLSFMKLSIWFSKLLATILYSLKKMINIPAAGSKPVHIAVASGQQGFDKMIHLMKHAAFPVIIKGRIAVDKNDTGSMIGNLDTAVPNIKSLGIDQLLLCEPELEYKKIIETVQELAGHIHFLFHAGNSNSIVGSNDKNGKGIFIASQ